MPLAKAIVLQDCEPDPDDPPGQLKLKKNDILEIIQMNDQRNDWLMGTKLDEEGSAPEAPEIGEINPYCVGLFIEPKYIQQLEIQFAELKRKVGELEYDVELLKAYSEEDINKIETLENFMNQQQTNINNNQENEGEDLFEHGGGKKKKNKRKSHKRKSHKRKSHKRKSHKRKSHKRKSHKSRKKYKKRSE